ncbi:MAG: hypothetical protein PHD55_07260 [Methanoregula sp.]|jgi:hypothetical protein|nr:hypothetical protein [Methanoregula sp.]
MQDVILIAKKRAFPSLGRVRLNVAHLDGLGIHDGERADLENGATKKIVTVTVIADKQVPEGQVRVSSEDLAALGLGDGDKVVVRRSVPLNEKISKAATDAGTSVSKSAKKIGTEVQKQTKQATEEISKAASKTSKKVKKTIKDAAGKGDEL